jgi:hypothetical protein
MPEGGAPKPWTEDLAKACEVSARLRVRLPSRVAFTDFGVVSWAPYQLIVVREALLWRTEEVARNACEAMEREDFAVAALLARSCGESAAMIWYLLKVLEERAGHTRDQLTAKLMQLLVGMKSKKDKATGPDVDDLPEAINVATFVKHVSRELPGFDKSYDLLSEVAHPNWLGVVGLYSKYDEENLETEFGRGLNAKRAIQIAHALALGLATFEVGYDKITDALPAFLDELEKL